MPRGQKYIEHVNATAILIIIEGLLQVFQRFSSSKLVLKTVERCFVSLKYYENGSSRAPHHYIPLEKVCHLQGLSLFHDMRGHVCRRYTALAWNV
jgi:hypothetical protein